MEWNAGCMQLPVCKLGFVRRALVFPITYLLINIYCIDSMCVFGLVCVIVCLCQFQIIWLKWVGICGLLCNAKHIM